MTFFMILSTKYHDISVHNIINDIYEIMNGIIDVINNMIE